MINQIVDDTRWERLKNTKHGQEFREQAMWYFMAGIVSHSWKPFNQMPFNGWYSDYNKQETYYTLAELKENNRICIG